MRKRRLPIGIIFLCLMMAVTGFGLYKFFSSTKMHVYVAMENLKPEGKTIGELVKDGKIQQLNIKFDDNVKPEDLIELSDVETIDLVNNRYLTKEFLKGYALSIPMIDDALRVNVPDGFKLIRVNLNAKSSLTKRLTETEQVSLYYQEIIDKNDASKNEWRLYARGLRMMQVTKSAEGELDSAEFLIPIAKIKSFLMVLSKNPLFIIDAKDDVNICYKNNDGTIDATNGLWCTTEFPKKEDINSSRTGDESFRAVTSTTPLTSTVGEQITNPIEAPSVANETIATSSVANGTIATSSVANETIATSSVTIAPTTVPTKNSNESKDIKVEVK